MRDVRRLLGFVATVAAVGAAACTEDLDGGAACPVLCPVQNVIIRDTTFDAITLDTSLAGFPVLGTEPAIVLTSRGDTVDVRAVIRFDSLASTFTHGGADSDITVIDSAYVLLFVDRTNSKVTAPVRIDVYDVDTTAEDTSAAAIRALFRSDRLIGGDVLDTAVLRDSVRVKLDNAPLLAKITAKARLRLGLRVSSTAAVQLRIGTRESSQAAVLRYDPSPDTAVKALNVSPRSQTPTNDPSIALDLTDYPVVFAEPVAPIAANVLRVGGLSGRRVYLRFDVPSRIVDSSTVLRATLILTQVPLRALDPADKFTLFPQLVSAGSEVTDLMRSAHLLNGAGNGFDSLQVAPGDSGVVLVEMVNALRTWAAVTTQAQQRALVLRAPGEGTLPAEAQFFSLRAAPSLRPRLRVSYSPRTNFGIP